MLTDFRSVFGAAFATADTARGWGSAVEGAGVVGGGNNVLDGARRPVLGVVASNRAGVFAGVDGVCSPEDFLVLATGRAGRAIVGGPLEGREGFGSVVVIL